MPTCYTWIETKIVVLKARIYLKNEKKNTIDIEILNKLHQA